MKTIPQSEASLLPKPLGRNFLREKMNEALILGIWQGAPQNIKPKVPESRFFEPAILGLTIRIGITFCLLLGALFILFNKSANLVEKERRGAYPNQSESQIKPIKGNPIHRQNKILD